MKSYHASSGNFARKSVGTTSEGTYRRIDCRPRRDIISSMSKGTSETLHLIKKWHEGDDKSLDALLERHLPWIRKRVRNRLGPLLRAKGETCDYVQDAVIQFLKYGPQIVTSSDGKFRALLCKIVENSLRDQHDRYTARRREVARERPLPPDSILNLDPPRGRVKTPSQSVERHEREAWVRLAMELVDLKDREMLIMRQWDDLSFAEIGVRLGIAEGTAQKRHYRAVVHLAKKVDDLRSGKCGEISW